MDIYRCLARALLGRSSITFVLGSGCNSLEATRLTFDNKFER